MSTEKNLHLVFNCACAHPSSEGEKTSDGYEACFGANVLGHHVFFMSLLTVLRKTAKQAGPQGVRVVNAVYDFGRRAEDYKLNFFDLGVESNKSSEDVSTSCLFFRRSHAE